MFHLRSTHAFVLIFALLALANVARAQDNSAPHGVESIDKAKPHSNPARGGSITGRVISDGGQPLAGVAVYAERFGAQSSPRSINTDANGKFRITDLVPATYTMHAILPGYVAAPDVQIATDSGLEESHYYHLGDDATLTMIKGGVITGKVSNSAGEAVIGARVQAIKVRDANNRLSISQKYLYQRTWQTNDLGIYRIYGLESGTYVIAVGGASPSYMGYILTAYDVDAPTYYPSATRDTAGEITLRGGEEASAIDVRYRGERGHTISGTIINAPVAKPGFSGASITLYRASTGMPEAATYISNDSGQGFAFDSVSDGEYDVVAQSYGANDASSAAMKSSPVRVALRGTNATGLKLSLQLLGSINGRVRFAEELKPECAGNKRPPAAPPEVVINVRRDERETAKTRSPLTAPFGFSGTPNADGDFAIRNLEAGLYRLQVRTPNEHWYVASIQSSVTNDKRNNDEAFRLQSGEQKGGLTITLAGGAAQLTGRVVATVENTHLPTTLHVYLVPLEAERADDALRYAETYADQDGAFRFKGVAPGRYKLIARVVDAASGNGAAGANPKQPFLWDATNRARLQRAGAASEGTAISLQPCQAVADYTLRFAASPIHNAPASKE